ncbi:MAG: FdtA/QdtA family cupin domain-containing protein [Bacteroidetes bacterium]|nr:FdtA/QdtA family cupin domain-containing protein [Bacteroidota bacterium]
MAHIISIPTITDHRGNLSVLEKILPFEIKRMYYIYDVPNINITRAGHKHIKNIQALISIAGKCEVIVKTNETFTQFILDKPNICLILNPEDWHTLENFEQGTVLVVLASEYFDEKDYIDEI